MIRAVVCTLLVVGSVMSIAQDTLLKLYRPFGDVTEQIPLVVKKVIEGHCDTQSQLILREDAWRCVADDRVFDPCFASLTDNQTYVLCPQSPWSGDSVQINVAAPLNNTHHVMLDMSAVFPWAVELANGERCQAVKTTERYDSMPIRYQCTNQNVLIGYLQRCKPVWSMLEKTSEGVNSIAFTKAWF